LEPKKKFMKNQKTDITFEPNDLETPFWKGLFSFFIHHNSKYRAKLA
jgi:hypothetical protein